MILDLKLLDDPRNDMKIFLLDHASLLNYIIRYGRKIGLFVLSIITIGIITQL